MYAQVGTHALCRAAHVQDFAGSQGERFVNRCGLVVDGRLERRSEDNSAEIGVGLQDRALQRDLQSGGEGRIAYQGVAQSQAESIRRSAKRDPQAAMVGSAPVDDKSAQAGFEDS